MSLVKFPKKCSIFMNLYIPQGNDNFFHRMVKSFTFNFIVFIYHFKS